MPTLSHPDRKAPRMKLLHSPTSPYVRKVLMLLHETGLTDKVAVETVASTPIAENPTLTAANPLGRIPCLLRDDGPALFDSRVICQYLDSLHGGRTFYPAAPALWTTLTLEALADGMLDSAVSGMYERRLRPADMQFAPWIDAQRGKVVRALDALETLWTAHLEGPPDAGALAVAATLGYLDLRYGDLNWRDARPKLAAWHARVAERPSYAATAPTP